MPQYLIIVGGAWRRIIKPLQNRSECDGLASKVRYIRLKMKIFLGWFCVISPKNLPFGAYKQKKRTYVMAILKHRKLVFWTALSSVHFYSISVFVLNSGFRALVFLKKVKEKTY